LRSSLSCIVPPTAFSKATTPSIMPKPPTNTPEHVGGLGPFRRLSSPCQRRATNPNNFPLPSSSPTSLRISILSTVIRYRLVGM
jgi:hypothetical protein